MLLQGEVIFSRDIPVGGFHFTNEISKNMGVTFEEAESLKISQSNKQEVPEETRTFMNIALEHVTEEIRNSIDFYTATQDSRLPYFCSSLNTSPSDPGFYTINLPPDFSGAGEIAVYNNEIYVAGTFIASPSSLRNIAKFDGNNWVNLGNGAPGAISTIFRIKVFHLNQSFQTGQAGHVLIKKNNVNVS